MIVALLTPEIPRLQLKVSLNRLCERMYSVFVGSGRGLSSAELTPNLSLQSTSQSSSSLDSSFHCLDTLRTCPGASATCIRVSLSWELELSVLRILRLQIPIATYQLHRLKLVASQNDRICGTRSDTSLGSTEYTVVLGGKANSGILFIVQYNGSR